MAYRVAVITHDDRDWVFNEITFATEEEANGYRIDLFSRWTALVDSKIVAVNAPVNVRWEEGRLIFIGHEDIQIKPENEGHGI